MPYGFIVVLLAASVLVMVFRPKHHNRPDARQTTDPAAATTVTPAAQAASPAVPPNTPQASITQPATTITPSIDDLQKQVIAFETAYFARQPGDTPDQRRERLRPIATPEFLASIDLGGPQAGKGLSNADRALQEKGMTVTASLTGEQISGELTADDQAEVDAIVLVSVVQDGKPSQHTAIHHSFWIKTDQGWRVNGHQAPGTG